MLYQINHVSAKDGLFLLSNQGKRLFSGTVFKSILQKTHLDNFNFP